MHAHNLYVQMTVEYGVIGSIAFMALLGVVVTILVRTRGRLQGDRASIGWHNGFGEVLALLLLGVGSTPYQSRLSIVFWSVTGIFLSQVRAAPDTRRPCT
jgi:O-antigen ligase